MRQYRTSTSFPSETLFQESCITNSSWALFLIKIFLFTESLYLLYRCTFSFKTRITKFYSIPIAWYRGHLNSVVQGTELLPPERPASSGKPDMLVLRHRKNVGRIFVILLLTILLFGPAAGGIESTMVSALSMLCRVKYI